MPNPGLPEVTDNPQKLEIDLLECSPGDSGRLKQIYQTYSRSEDFLSRLISCCESGNLEQSATWLIKRHLEAGRPADAQESSRIVSLLESASHWQTKLHILQSVRHLDIPGCDRQSCFSSLKILIRHRRNFVRAWAYDALYALAQQDAGLRGEAMQLFFAAQDDSAASVQARIRNILNAK